MPAHVIPDVLLWCFKDLHKNVSFSILIYPDHIAHCVSVGQLVWASILRPARGLEKQAQLQGPRRLAAGDSWDMLGYAGIMLGIPRVDIGYHRITYDNIGKHW